VVGSEVTAGDLWVRVDVSQWRKAAEVAKSELGMDYFCFLSGIDWLPNPDLDSENPTAPSWVPVYRGADWHEREAWEMYGFDFEGHPGLRHMYLPGEFEGHPLRKDFPMLAREVKPWPGLVDKEQIPGEADAGDSDASGTEAAGTEG
jgi:NADH-quinone oxidoreductase subunit C